MSFPQSKKSSIYPQFPHVYPHKILEIKRKILPHLRIFIHLCQALSIKRGSFQHLWKTCVGKFFVQISNKIEQTFIRNVGGVYISSAAEALREVSAILPARYSKQPETAIIAPLSPQSDLGGTTNLTPLLSQSFSSAERR